ncbi:MAG: hypothetical protein HQL22_11920 [Candidatus Omnitrophica bacterium]|nr:hypothetical protein [Candidatus Omnitrophota bacterium]
MSKQVKTYSRIEIALIIGILAIASFWTWIFFRPPPLDDAYVTLRYAQHFLQGHGLVFNLGEHVESYSSYLCQMLTCFGVFLGIPGDVFLQGQGVFCYFLTLLLLMRFAKRQIGRHCLYLCIPILYAFSLANSFWSGIGLETMLFSFLLLSSIVFYLQFNQTRWQRIFVGVWCCLLSLSRPEAVAYYALILIFEFFYQWLVRREINFVYLLEYSAGLVIFIFYVFSRWEYYGYVMPNTYYQKVGYNVTVWHHGFDYLREFINFNVGGCLVLFLVVVYGVFFRRDRVWWLFFLIFLMFSGIVVLSGGNNWPFWRYAMPCQPLLLVLIGIFINDALLCADKLKGCWSLLLRTSVLFLFSTILLSSSVGILLNPSSFGFSENNQRFHAIAKFYGQAFQLMLSSHQSISLNALPFVAYYYGGWAYDPLGLTDSKIAHRKVEMGKRVYSHEKGDGRYILGVRPTVICFGPGLNLVDRPNVDYPRLEDLYFISDIEIVREGDFKRLYEPYNIYIPTAKMYLSFYKLKDQSIKVPIDQINLIYQTLMRKEDTFKDRLAAKASFLASYLDKSFFSRVRLNLMRVIQLEKVADEKDGRINSNL